MEVVVRHVPGQRKGGKHYITEDNYVFHRYKGREDSDSASYRCRKYESLRCLARLSRKGDQFTETGSEHNHGDETAEIGRIAVVNTCVQRASEPRIRLKRTFEEVRERDPEVVIGYNHALERRMQREKRLHQPPIPQSVEEAERLIREYPVYNQTLDETASFYQGRVSTEAGTALLFISVALLPQLRQAVQLHADGTFRTVPKIFYQLFTIHFMAYGKAFPFAYILMTRKTRCLYDKVLERVKEVVQETVPGEGYAVQLMISDYEEAIFGSMAAAFPTGRVRGCFFHYGQAIYRKACQLGLAVAYKNINVIRKIVKMMIALALLPTNDIFEGFRIIQAETAAALQDESDELKSAVARLFSYMGGYWLATQGPETISVHGDRTRTNNFIEAFNRWFNGRCDAAHLNFWDFVHHLQKEEESTRRDFVAIQANQAVGRKRAKLQETRDEDIAKHTSDLDNGIITKLQFLELTSLCFEPAGVLPVIQENGIVEAVIVAPRQRRQQGRVRVVGRQRNPAGLVIRPRRVEAEAAFIEDLVNNNEPLANMIIEAEGPLAVAEEPLVPVAEEAQRRVAEDQLAPADGEPLIPDGEEPLVDFADEANVVVDAVVDVPIVAAAIVVNEVRRNARQRRLPAHLRPDAEAPMMPIVREPRQPRQPRQPPNQNRLRGRPRLNPAPIAPQIPQPNLQNDPRICDICTITLRDTVFQPCGHTVCSNCANRAVDCYFCRTPVAHSFRMFI